MSLEHVNPAQLGVPQAPVFCENARDTCVQGAKQLIVWNQADGNNVQLDRELFTMTRASADFAAAEAALAAKFRLIRFAINEGR